MQPNFEAMNETDVREIIVRPLLDRLGYKHGTQANIRTEVTLKYDHAFLGRKKPSRDPALSGRADYICDAVSYGRWAVEVKAPAHDISQDDVEQAHTYCAHPEIGAAFFMVTNGREFRLYATGQLEQPLLSWTYEETEKHLMTLFNVVGYEAIKRITRSIRPDMNKPLGPGLPSTMRIVGGQVDYGDHSSDHPLFQVDALNGTKGPITGIRVGRDNEARIHAIIKIVSPYQQLENLNKLAGIDNFEFFSSDEYISRDFQRPTIFQNVQVGQLEPGAMLKLLPGIPEIRLPFGFQFYVETTATGFMEEEDFVGLLSFDYHYQFIRGRPSGIPQLDAMVAAAPPTARLKGEGQFRVVLVV